MKKELKKKFDELNELWDSKFKGENPECDVILNDILSILCTLDTTSITDVLQELSNKNISQICPIVEELIQFDSNLKDVFISIMKESKNPDLKSELSIIGAM